MATFLQPMHILLRSFVRGPINYATSISIILLEKNNLLRRSLLEENSRQVTGCPDISNFNDGGLLVILFFSTSKDRMGLINY